MTAQMTANEMVLSLTGFDELAIEQHMGVDPYADGERKPLKVLRALVFVQKTREGLSPKDARRSAMEMPMDAVQGLFKDDPADEDGGEDLPVTESGEGSAPSD